MEKVCTMCGRLLPIEQFPTNRGMADGHLGKCFECWPLFTGYLGKRSEKEEQKRLENKKKAQKPKKSKKKRSLEKDRANHRAYYQRLKADPERYAAKLARCRENSRKWYSENRELLKSCEPMSECERRHQRRMLQAKEREENKEKQPALKPVKTYNHELRNIAKSGD